jgi:hypothetical protein
MKIIGIAGPPESGKDTIADLIADKGYYKSSFAKALREIVYSIYNLDKSYMGNRNYESKSLINGKSIKQVLAHIGTEGFRTIDPNTWIDCLDREIINIDKVVISDVRFPNEVDYIKNKGGLLLWIDRSRDKPKTLLGQLFLLFSLDRLPDGRSLQHDSESHWSYSKSNADVIIRNEGNLEDLKLNLFRGKTREYIYK